MLFASHALRHSVGYTWSGYENRMTFDNFDQEAALLCLNPETPRHIPNSLIDITNGSIPSITKLTSSLGSQTVQITALYIKYGSYTLALDT